MTKNEKGLKKIDRVILDKKTVAILNDLVITANLDLGEGSEVNLKLLTNFLLRNRCEKLSRKELSLLKTENHDVLKALKRAVTLAIEAKNNGSKFDCDDALKIIQTPGVIEKIPVLHPRQRKIKSKHAETEKTSEFAEPEVSRES